MFLNEDNYIEIINSYDKKHWQPLLDLIPEIESNNQIGKMAVEGKDAEGDIPIPDFIVFNFQKLAYDLGLIIDFEWFKWDDGREIARNKDFDFDMIDVPAKCKLITAIIRQDRFNDGVLVSAFESGLILKILQSINRQLIDR